MFETGAAGGLGHRSRAGTLIRAWMLVCRGIDEAGPHKSCFGILDGSVRKYRNHLGFMNLDDIIKFKYDKFRPRNEIRRNVFRLIGVMLFSIKMYDLSYTDLTTDHSFKLWNAK
jgi:hypothetical protein